MADKSVFSDAGKRGAAKRWGPPRLIRLDGLNAEQRRLVLAMVDMARATETRKAASQSEGETAGAEVGRGSVERSAA